jgi:DNA topoisomerase 2-associated protein PAT1
MSFFGLETNHDALEKEKEKFLEGGKAAQEDVAVFNWGESDYDGLGEALQEGGDEMNDETFGDGPVGACGCLQMFAHHLSQS